MRFPRTFLGWWRLACLTLRLCPVHLGLLRLDPWSPWDRHLYCFKCEGWAMWPRGFFEALRSNARATAKAAEGGNEHG